MAPETLNSLLTLAEVAGMLRYLCAILRNAGNDSAVVLDQTMSGVAEAQTGLNSCNPIQWSLRQCYFGSVLWQNARFKFQIVCFPIESSKI